MIKTWTNFERGLREVRTTNDEISKLNNILSEIYSNPKKMLGQSCPRSHYIKKLYSLLEDGYNIEEGVYIVLDIIESDYRSKLLGRSTYYYCKNTILKILRIYREKYKENSNINFEKLLVDFLLRIYKFGRIPPKINANIISEWLNIDMETASKFLKLLKTTEYGFIVRAVVKEVERLRSEKQH